MRVRINHKTLSLKLGDITDERADALVDCPNSCLAGGGRVWDAFKDAAGYRMSDELGRQSGCPTGQAVVTSGGLLPVPYIFHTVGPVWSGGQDREEELLRRAYRSVLKLADNRQVGTIAFPAISTGLFGYPMRPAAQVAITTVGEHLQGPSPITAATIVLFTPEALRIHKAVLDEISRERDWPLDNGD